MVEEKKKRNKKKNRKKRAYIILASFLALCFITAASFYTVYSYLLKLSVNAKKSNIAPVEAKKDEPVNILIMGVDIGTAGSSNKNDPKRTDTIMVMHYEPKSKKIDVVSIPRDTLITIKGKREKINAAHAVGGVPYLIDAVEKLLDLRINYYGKIDYNGFRSLIDTIGGVDMYIANRMDYDDPEQNLHIHFKKGETVHLNGKKAEEFFRWRKNNDNTGFADGDIGRIENQHLFIQKVIEKIKSPSIITKIPGIMKLVPQYAETNMNPEDILKYGWLISNTEKDSIVMHTLKGKPDYIGGVSYFIYEEKENMDLLTILHGGNYEKKVSSSNTSTAFANAPQLDKNKYSIQVLNGTKTSGLATKYAEGLKSKGYQKVLISNYKSSVSKNGVKSKIQVYGIDEKYYDSIKGQFGINNIERLSKKQGNFDIIVLLGDDYNIKQ